MRSFVARSWSPFLFGLVLATATSALAADRAAKDILKDVDAVKFPTVDASRRSDPAYRQQFQNEYMAAMARQDALIFELFKTDPDNDRLPELMSIHWRRTRPVGPNASKVDREIQDVLARSHNQKLRLEAHFALAQYKLIQAAQRGVADLSGVEEFIKNAPKDERGALLLQMAMSVARDEKTTGALENRILKEFPDSRSAASILGIRRQLEGIGKPFELEFADAISGSTISMKALKSKVVVIDFWATWCGPCVAEMPHMKELYAEYHNKGVEFIGVSLDNPKEEGGLDSLKNYVKSNGINWPQYYQGKGWDSEFSTSWGIQGIPTMFIVDTEGKLYSVEARGQLEKLIPKLLEKKGGRAASPAAGE